MEIDADNGNDVVVRRDAGGRWLPGASGNPNGRPVGASGVGLRMARDYAIELLPVLMEEARSGNMDIAKFIVGLGLPKQKPVMVPGALPNSPAGLLDAMAIGDIPADVCNEALQGHLVARKIDELGELARRVEHLEELLSGGGRQHEKTA